MTEIDGTPNGEALVGQCAKSENLESNKSKENSVESTNNGSIKCTNHIEVHWGFSLPELYRISLRFYKEKEGKAIHIGYEEKTKLVALSQQVSHGPYDPTSVSDVGVLDVVGKDRRLAWQSLGSITNEEAMEQFIYKLNDSAPKFKPYVEALYADRLEKERIAKEEEEKRKEEEAKKMEEQLQQQKEEEERRQQEDKKRQIQEALNQQTYEQFRSYAERWYPGNPEQQGVLILQLQKQHYEQYMQQIYQQQLLVQQQQNNQEISESIDNELLLDTSQKSLENGNTNSIAEANDSTQNKIENNQQEEIYQDNEEEGEEEDDDEEDQLNSSVTAASMWTRRDIKEFKDSIKKEGGESIIKVGHGKTVTVRVPTHEDGTCLFWEFATDSYDIGFGVYFEWTNDAGSVVSVHTESEDEDDDDDVEENTDDIERIAGADYSNTSDKPPLSMVIPVYRRDCHEEVYAGSHSYPGCGVYLLKFDNSYSLWRSKTLYYRVYYTR